MLFRFMETEEGLKLRAYSEAMKLKHQGLEKDIIYARLEKQGIPEELALEVSNNIFIQQKIEEKNEIANVIEANNYKLTLSIVLSAILAIVSLIFFSAIVVIIPVGFIVGILVRNYLLNKDREN